MTLGERCSNELRDLGSWPHTLNLDQKIQGQAKREGRNLTIKDLLLPPAHRCLVEAVSTRAGRCRKDQLPPISRASVMASGHKDHQLHEGQVGEGPDHIGTQR